MTESAINDTPFDLVKLELCLRCSEKDKKVIVYFMLELDCNVCILDSLFHTSMAFVALLDETKAKDFCHAVIADIQACITRFLGSPTISNEGFVKWDDDKVETIVYKSVKSNKDRVIIEHSSTLSLFIYIRIINGAVWFDSSSKTERRPFPAGLFQWFMGVCVHNMVNYHIHERDGVPE